MCVCVFVVNVKVLMLEVFMRAISRARRTSSAFPFSNDAGQSSMGWPQCICGPEVRHSRMLVLGQ